MNKPNAKADVQTQGEAKKGKPRTNFFEMNVMPYPKPEVWMHDEDHHL